MLKISLIWKGVKGCDSVQNACRYLFFLAVKEPER